MGVSRTQWIDFLGNTHFLIEKNDVGEAVACQDVHAPGKCPWGRLTQLLRIMAASEFNWMNNDVWESFLPTQKLGRAILVHLVTIILCCWVSQWRDRRDVLGQAADCLQVKKEFLVQETNSASWEGGSCGGIPPVDGLSSLGEVSIPDPGVQRGRHFSWSPTVKVLLISSLQPSQAHLVLLASLILDLWGEWTYSIHLAWFFFHQEILALCHVLG